MLELGNNPRASNLDGSILWVVDEYTHDEWFHTLTKLNKYCFLIQEETGYLEYLEPVPRKGGAYCSNLLDYISYYESQGWVVHKEYDHKNKSVFKLTEEGRERMNELLTPEQISILQDCLNEWEDMYILNLVDEVYSKYPEYSL